MVKTRLPGILLGLTFALLACLSLKQDDVRAASTGHSSHQKAGRIAYLDPVTGKLSKAMPPAGLAIPMDFNALRRFSTSSNGLVPEIGKNGTIIVPLQGRFRQGSYALKDASGNLRIQRLDGSIFTSPDGRELASQLDNSSASPLRGEK